ncbi:hypothetical protein [Jeotgalibaca porci]|uniref:hypothetical protein n=1 Tax=Jeotgalibaca porci TaxID=1868793 RepID=UPI00359FCD3A
MSGHKLYTPKDFENMSWEEQDGNFLYAVVVNGGLNVCKVCGEAESGLDKPCRSNVKEVPDMYRAHAQTID